MFKLGVILTRVQPHELSIKAKIEMEFKAFNFQRREAGEFKVHLCGNFTYKNGQTTHQCHEQIRDERPPIVENGQSSKIKFL